jgi:hypothetical protein
LVDDVAEGALQGQGFGGEGAGGGDGAGVFLPQRVKADGGSVSIVRTDTRQDAKRNAVPHPLFFACFGRACNCYVQVVICLKRVQGCIRLRQWPEG